MKPLIAIESCHRDRWCHAQIRDTWLSAPAADTRFFLGVPKEPDAEADETFLDVPDGGGSELRLKILGSISWALANGYDNLFRCDTDTYVHVPRLLASGFERHDYSGFVQGDDSVFGGTGYWLSRRAMEALLARGEIAACSGAEDWWVRYVLRQAGILPFHDPRYRIGTDRGTMVGPQPDNDVITCHNHERNSLTNLRDRANLYAVHEKAKGIL